MKDNLPKQEIKIEWDCQRVGASPLQLPRSSEDQAASPRSVITQRHVRTITTAGHITETIAEAEPESPTRSPISGGLQQVLQHRAKEPIHNPRYRTPDSQHQYIEVPHYGSPENKSNDHTRTHEQYIQVSHNGASVHHNVIYTSSENKDTVENSGEPTIAVTIKEPPR